MNANYEFFDEYAKLDKLCSELYRMEHGATVYINDMISVPESEYGFIRGWEQDLNQLLRLRHIRNHLAHNPGAFKEPYCNKSDIEWTRNFIKRIHARQDPLAVLEDYEKSIQAKRGTNSDDQQSSNYIWVGILAIGLIAIVGLLIYASIEFWPI